jgi:pseudouridine-5'-phosphate glycosidase
LKLRSGILVTVPVPAEDEIPVEEIEAWAEQATAEAQAEGIGGGALTPFMLQRLGELSEGRTTRTNISLLHNNAHVAAQIAVALG